MPRDVGVVVITTTIDPFSASFFAMQRTAVMIKHYFTTRNATNTLVMLEFVYLLAFSVVKSFVAPLKVGSSVIKDDGHLREIRLQTGFYYHLSIEHYCFGVFLNLLHQKTRYQIYY